MTNKYSKTFSIAGGNIIGIFPAMILANFEAELKAKTEKLREQNKSMMQPLLMGKVRLKID